MAKAKVKRNEEIRRRVASGDALVDVARDYGITPQRIQHIIDPRRQAARIAAQSSVPIRNGQPCERCRCSVARQRHHPDYDQPERVELLCLRCHRTADRECIEAEARQALRLSASDDLETVSDAVRRLGVDQYALYAAVDSGKLRSYRGERGRMRLVVSREADVWLDSYRHRLRKTPARRPRKALCSRGHVLADWNTRLCRGGGRACLACCARSVGRFNGYGIPGRATNYEIKLALDKLGFTIVRFNQRRIWAEFGDTEVMLSTGGSSPWLVYINGRRSGDTRTVADLNRILLPTDEVSA